MNSSEAPPAHHALGDEEKTRLVTELWREREAHRATKTRCDFLLQLLVKQTRNLRLVLDPTNTPQTAQTSFPLLDENMASLQTQPTEKDEASLLLQNASELQTQVQETIQRLRQDNNELQTRLDEMQETEKQISLLLSSAVLVKVRSDAEADADDEEEGDSLSRSTMASAALEADPSHQEESSANPLEKVASLVERVRLIVQNLSVAAQLANAANLQVLDVKQRYGTVLMKESKRFEQAKKAYEEEIARLRARDVQRVKEIEQLRAVCMEMDGSQAQVLHLTGVGLESGGSRRSSIVDERLRKQSVSLSRIFYEKVGWLTKQGSKWKTWKTRFFVLRGSSLMIYRDSERKVLMGIISMTGVECHSVENPSNDKKYYFEVRPGPSGMMGQKNSGESVEIVRYSTLLVHTLTESDRAEWITAINANSQIEAS